MTNLVYFLLIFVLIRLAFCQFQIKNITKFPLPLGRPFEITVSVNPSPYVTLELMVTQTTDFNGFDEDFAIFDFGRKKDVLQEFQSEYMTIPILGIFKKKGVIYTSINFTKYANNRILEIYYINPNSTKQRRDMLRDLKPNQRMYRNNILLIVPPQLELKMDLQNRSEVTVEPNSSLTISCQALDGRPEIVKSNMKIESNIFLPGSNIQKITIRTSMLDHNRTLTCHAKNVTKFARIFIYHAPTKVQLQPEVKNFLGNNTGIICFALNGYPTPWISWNFIHGPLNASLYYHISPYTQRLYMKENAPIGSSWKFICSATNSFFERPRTFNKTVSFTIIHQQRNKTQPIFNSYYNTSKIKNNFRNPDQFNYTLEQIKEIKLGIFLRGIVITNLKDSIRAQNSEIFQLNQTIRQLRETQKETTGDIKFLQQIFSIEIGNMKKELNSLKAYMTSKNKNIQTRRTGIISTTTKVVILPYFSFNYKINSVSRLRRKDKSFRSEKFFSPQIRFPVTLYFKFRRMEILHITVHMSRINDAESSLVIKGYVTLSISNAENLEKQMSMRKFFQRNRRSANVDFVFNYIDLHMNQVLQSDNIIVKCSLSIIV